MIGGKPVHSLWQSSSKYAEYWLHEEDQLVHWGSNETNHAD
jgi:hypothetical protein